MAPLTYFQQWRRCQPQAEPPTEEEEGTPGVTLPEEVATAAAGGVEAGVEAEVGDVTAAAVIITHLVPPILHHRHPNPSRAASCAGPPTESTSVPSAASRTAR